MAACFELLERVFIVGGENDFELGSLARVNDPHKPHLENRSGLHKDHVADLLVRKYR